MAKKPPTAVPLERQLAALAIAPPELGDFLQDDEASRLWNRLLAELREEINSASNWPDHRRGRVLEQLKAALPSEKLRRLMFQYGEAADTEAHARERAAYLLGIEIGRRIADGAR